MKFIFSKDYLNSLEDSDEEVKEIDPNNCSKIEFRALIAFCAVSCSSQISGLKENISALRAENEDLKGRVKSLEESQNSLVENNSKLTSDLGDCSKKVTDLEEANRSLMLRVEVLEKSRSKSDKQWEKESERILNLERHSRKRNVRFILPQPETEKENTTEILTKELQKIGLNPHIEHSHRTGKLVEGKPRQIIACFSNRPEMYHMLSKKSLLYQNNIKVFEDLCHTDYMEKMKHSAHMSRLFREGKKVKFSRGCWYVDNVKFSGTESEDW